VSNVADFTVEKSRQLMTMAPGASIAPIVPRSIEEAFRIAEMLMIAKMAPDSLKSAEALCVAILHGMEVGLTPLAAVQSIAVINGKPSLWGDGFLAVIQGSGLLEWKKEYEEVVEGEGLTAFCVMKRRGDPEPATCKFSEKDARAASLENKSGPWKTYPARMRKMRARAFCGRDLFSDVLKGIRSAEEVNDYVDVTPNGDASQASGQRPSVSSRLRPPPPPPVRQEEPKQEVATQAPEAVEEQAEPEFEPRTFCASIVRRLDAAKTTDDTDVILGDMTSENDRLSKEQRDYLKIKHGECVDAIKRGR
jgi:hypothetical protein